MAKELFPLPDNEHARQHALNGYDLIGGPPLPDLPAVAELAADLCGVPNAVVNLISAREQHPIAAVGIDPSVCAREDSMCATTIVECAPVIVADARLDPRFANNPHVTGELDDIRCYAAAQLRTPDGHALGTLCVFDTEVRELSHRQRDGLEKLARIVMDVFELHRHSRMLGDALKTVQRTSRELSRSNAALRHFAGQVSHDLKNPLTGVLGFVSLLTEIPAVAGDPDAKRCADRALSSSTRMWRLIEDVLAHASVGGLPQFGQVALSDLVAHILDDLASMIRTADASIAVGPLPVVVGDATQLRVLLQNLISNAVKFRNPIRPCEVRITGEHGPTEWIIKVADNGIGIEPEDRHRVLEMFTRLHDQIEGSGIGLATCQRVAELHGAALRIGDTKGGGTTVTLTMPRHPRAGSTGRTSIGELVGIGAP